jgi:hypothetical protein
MPTVSHIDGVDVDMYYNDHDPPHVHFVTADDVIRIRLKDRGIMSGSGSPATLRKIDKWMVGHMHELWVNWRRARRGETLHDIVGV